ncbi:MAG: hypothetical protein ABI600_04880 [Luteolibacter sp.]
MLYATIMMTEVAVPKDYAGPYRPYSADFDGYDSVLNGLDEAAYGRMSLEDPILKRAYRAVFGSSINGVFNNLPPEVSAALVDLRKRGDTVTPMLLQLMERNQETGLESSILVSIAAVGTIQLDPYLDYARNLLRNRTQTMSGAAAECASNLLAEHGTKEDAKLMKWVMETHPWEADGITRKLDELNRRLNLPKQEPRPPLRGTPATSDFPNVESRSVKHQIAPVSEKKKEEVTHWIVWPLAILVAVGLLRLVLKKRK